MREKLKHIVHYICSEFKDYPERLGLIKLNKICWFSDVDWYFLSHNTITEYTTYTKQPQGPALPDIKIAINQLCNEGKLSAELVEFPEYKQWYYTCKQDFNNLSVIDKKEKEVLDFWIEYAKKKSAQEMSNHAHNYLWWEEASENEAIPVSFGVLIRDLISGSALSERRHGEEVTDKKIPLPKRGEHK